MVITQKTHSKRNHYIPKETITLQKKPLHYKRNHCIAKETIALQKKPLHC